MADLLGHGTDNRELDKVLVALKKGAQLLKYGRKGKPKFYPFRLSNDETSLVWLASGGERSLKLASVSKIIPGQRTSVFHRYLQPEKDYLSFSLIYNKGKRSLDLICKDKVEADLWFAGLKSLISLEQSGRSKIDGWSGGLHFDDPKDLISDSQSNSSISTTLGVSSPDSNTNTSTSHTISSFENSVRPEELNVTNMHVKGTSSDVFRVSVSSAPSTSSHGSAQDDCDALGDVYVWGEVICDAFGRIEADKHNSNTNTSTSHTISSFENSVRPEELNVTNMHVKGTSSDVFRVSVSSAPSTSSHGSAQDDCDALGDVYVWGEVICDAFGRIEADKHNSPFITKSDILLPKPLESNIVLDVHHVACGVRHAALVTRQGEVFTWGEESGGRLGHGVGADVAHPRFVESLALSNIDFVACGKFHTCAVSLAGELYTWGDGTHNVGLLGHGTDVSHWIPKRVSGPLDGLQVAHVTCGTWHTALITSTGQLFTFGDGTFGVLGHGNRESYSYPREVESLMGLKTIAVSCGVWHTAAVVEVIVTQSSATVSSGKLFTWGDGDKFRLGHGDKEPRLKPTCVPSLIDFNFHKLACGHSLTVGLTTSGQVFTMGITVYGQLGNLHSDGKLPCLVEDRLASEFVGEVACGSYHVAVMTARSEVYTWGNGVNGRLGHGDLEDRKTPTLVEALKDRHVKRIACGSNFTVAICNHKWVSGADQSQCSTCRQAFGFTRKRHNCYNCGLVHCHSCSSKKAQRGAMSPNPEKPYRVCDSCYVKLNMVLESGGTNRRYVAPRLSGENKEKFDKTDMKLQKASFPSNLDLIKNLDIKAGKQGRKADSLSLIRPPQVPPLLQLKDIAFIGGDLYRAFPKAVRTSAVQSVNPSRAVSPFSRKSCPPRSATPVPTTAGLSFPKNVADGLKKTNELLSQEVQKLCAQRCELQVFELQISVKKAQEATELVAEESAKSKAAKDVIKSLTAQLKDMAGRVTDVVSQREMQPTPTGIELHSPYRSYLDAEQQIKTDTSNGLNNASPAITRSAHTNRISDHNYAPNPNEANETTAQLRIHRNTSVNGTREHQFRGAMNTDNRGGRQL